MGKSVKKEVHSLHCHHSPLPTSWINATSLIFQPKLKAFSSAVLILIPPLVILTVVTINEIRKDQWAARPQEIWWSTFIRMHHGIPNFETWEFKTRKSTSSCQHCYPLKHQEPLYASDSDSWSVKVPFPTPEGLTSHPFLKYYYTKIAT